MTAPTPSYHPSPSRPKLRLPPGACDTHFHIFGPQSVYPLAPDRSYTPADAPREKLFALHAMLGIERGVIVQSGSHGFDNTVVVDAIAAKPASYTGIALVRTSISDKDLQQLNAKGICGARFHYMKHLGAGPSIDDVVAFSKRLAPLGWHLQIHLESTLIAEMMPKLKQSAVPVVIDHMGRLDASLGIDQAPFRHLRELLRDDRFLVKVSCCERASRKGAPYADAVPFARALVSEFGDRTLWGTDWPHPNVTGGIPDDGLLVDLLSEIAPTAAERQRLLVDNPAKFYRFPRQA